MFISKEALIAMVMVATGVTFPASTPFVQIVRADEEVLVGSGRCFLGSLMTTGSNVNASIAEEERMERIGRFIQEEMDDAGVPGLSIAVIDGGEIAWACGHGFLEKDGDMPVTPETLLLAGSVSKPVAATGALRLVQEGALTLDADVNQDLVSWQVPKSNAAKDSVVTLRRLLAHTAGLTVHGFSGYNRDAPAIPTTPQILDGVDPANSDPVRVTFEPGTDFRYSGGGYTVMQLLLSDVADQPFASLMQEKVLEPFVMSSSTFENPLPESLHSLAASGYNGRGRAIEGGWHVYPEMAAAGLWTTASDLARWVIGIQQAFTGESTDAVLNQTTATEMLSEQFDHGDNYWQGLGPVLLGLDEDKMFAHEGRDDGFDTVVFGFREKGQGVAILINKNDDSDFLGRIVDEVAREYNWSGVLSSAAPSQPNLGGCLYFAILATVATSFSGLF